MIIVNLTSEVPSTKKGDPYLPANKQIGLKGSLYDDFLRKKFGIDRESLMRQYGNVPSTPTGPVKMPITGGEESTKPLKEDWWNF
jgi:hypothetical protein